MKSGTATLVRLASVCLVLFVAIALNSCGRLGQSPSNALPQPEIAAPTEPTGELLPREGQGIPLWVTMNVGTVNEGPFSSVIEHEGIPYIAFLGRTGGLNRLKIAKATSATPSTSAHWVIYDIDATSCDGSNYGLGEWCTLVETTISGQPRLAVAYYENVCGDLKVAVATQTSPTSTSHWTKMTVERYRDTGTANSVCVFPYGGNSHLAISHFSASRRSLRVSYANTPNPTTSAHWVSNTIDNGDNDVGSFSSINYFNWGSGDRLGVAYYDSTRSDLMFVGATAAAPTASDWSTPHIIDGTDQFGFNDELEHSDAGHYCTLLRAGGKALIVYQVEQDRVKGALQIGTGMPTYHASWNRYTISEGGAVEGFWLAGAQREDSVPYITFKQGESSGNVWAARSSTTTPDDEADWTTSRVHDTAVNFGYDTSCALSAGGSTGRLWISYGDETNNQLVFARGDAVWD